MGRLQEASVRRREAPSEEETYEKFDRLGLARCRRHAACGRRCLGPDRDPVVARDDRRQQRRHRQARHRLQRRPEGLQGRADLQGQLSRHHERRHRRVPRRQRAAHHAGVRGRHRHDDGGHRRGEAGARADEGGRRGVRPQGLSAGHHRLLLDHQGRDAVVPVQLVQHGDVVQQGRASRRPASTPTSRRRPGPRCSTPPRS